MVSFTLSGRLPSTRPLATWAMAVAMLCATSHSAQAMLVTFDWAAPNPRVVSLGATSVTVDLLAIQTDGADAGALTLGFTLGGIVTDVSLTSFGSAVSVADSLFGPSGSDILLIAAAPSPPTSFGADLDFIVATLTLTLDTALGKTGTLSLKDLTSLAGAPALASDGIAAIPSDISAVFSVAVPEPSTALLLGFGLVSLVGARSRSREDPRH